MLRDGFREEDVRSDAEVCCCRRRSRRLLLKCFVVGVVGWLAWREEESLTTRGLSLRFWGCRTIRRFAKRN
jgi:hypothetical protein